MEPPTLTQRSAAQRCGFCHDVLDDPRVACPACGVVLHAECHALTRVCVTLGCRPRISVDLDAPRPFFPRLLVALGSLLLVLVAGVALVANAPVEVADSEFRGPWPDSVEDERPGLGGQPDYAAITTRLSLMIEHAPPGPVRGWLLLQRADARRWTRDLVGSLRDAERAAAETGSADALRLEALSYAQLGDHASALATFERALGRADCVELLRVRVLRDRAEVWRTLGLSDLDRADRDAAFEGTTHSPEEETSSEQS